MKTIMSRLILFSLLFLTTSANAQNQSIASLSIEECYQWSKENYPLLRQLAIIDKTTQYNISNASNGNLPQVSVNGQATYQSDVTKLPIDIPNLEIPTINKDQYKIYAEVYQPLTNFSNVKDHKNIIAHNGAIEKQEIAIAIYKLKDRINQIFFGALLINDKIEQFEIIQTDLDSALVKVEAAIENGTATLIDRKLLQVERISLDQQIEENKANQLAFLEMLSTLTGKNITKNTELTLPAISPASFIINRPELQLFKLQNQTISLQQNQISNSLFPKVGIFAQGGYGRPALNFLSNEFDLYYIAGLKFNWNVSSLYNYKNTKKSLSLTSQKIAAQKEIFLMNTNLTQSQQSSEVSKYQGLINSDQEIIDIRSDVLITAKVQLNNGLITTIDYLKFLNDVNKAKQLKLLHETQLLLAQFNLKTTTGN